VTVPFLRRDELREVKWKVGNGYVVAGENCDYYSELRFCTCWAGLSGRECVHRRMVMWAMPVELREAIKKMKFMKSSIEGLNEVFGGHVYNSDEIVALYGKPQVGKTLFCLQEAVASNSNVLYIDTEGGFKGMAGKWLDILTERFKSKSKIYLEPAKNLQHLMEFFGFKTRVVFQASDDTDDEEEESQSKKTNIDKKSIEKIISDLQKKERKEMKVKGKMEFRVLEKYDNAPVDIWVEKSEIDFVILDSVSAPVRVLMPEERQNLPARATAMAIIMGKLVSLQQNYNVCVLVTNHASFDPMNPHGLAQMRGGIAVHHFAKRIIYMDMRDKKDLRNYRRLWIMRMEDEPKASMVVGARIDDVGFHYEKDVKKLLTDTEVERVG